MVARPITFPTTDAAAKPKLEDIPAATAAAVADRQAVTNLLVSSKAMGVKTVTRLARQALTRLFERGTSSVMQSGSLFDKSELQQLADTFASVNATAELLGRARVRLRQARAEELKGSRRFSADRTDLRLFAEIKPLRPETAIEFFKSLVPRLGTDPLRFGRRLERQAFTLAEATSHFMLTRVQEVLARALETGEVRGTVADINRILGEAGVSPRNPQYAEMVYRTNFMDAYVTGTEREMALDDVRETFPTWRYSNPDDGRSRPHHADKNGNYYSSADSFTKVRGDGIENIANCRCLPVMIDKWEWSELYDLGARVTAA